MIEEIIGNLLLRHNCVVVPSFGGFVARQLSAQIDYQSGLMLPPRKSLLFNRQLINNDGLLIAEFSRENQVAYDVAETEVKATIASWNNTLRDGNRVTIDRVGFLYFDSEKNICFEQDRYFNLLLSAYGLGKVHFLSETEVEMAKHTAEKEPVKTSETHSIIPQLDVIKSPIAAPAEKNEPVVVPLHPELKSKRKVWKYVAAACVLPLAFYSFWIPMKTDVLESKMISFQDFNPFHHTPVATYHPEESEIKSPSKQETETLDEQLKKVQTSQGTYAYNFSDDTFITVRLEQAVSSQTESPETTIAAPTIAHKAHTHFIVGCFSDATNASDLVTALKAQGFAAHVVDIKGGLHRVSIGSSDDASTMSMIKEKAHAAGYEGWILKK